MRLPIDQSSFRKTLVFLLLTLFFLVPAAFSDTSNTGNVLLVEITGPITPVQLEFLEQAIQAVPDGNAQAILLRLDTPGGLADSMRKMVMDMLASPVPVGVWVGPAGARAASAGVFLVAAGQPSAMSPQTTIGAATPIELSGKEMSETLSRKVVNDLVSLVRSLAQSRDRNENWYADAVLNAETLDASDAVLNKVVDFLASGPRDFLEQAASSGAFPASAAQARIIPYDPGFRYRILSWLADPSIAYFLLLGGLAGLFFEMTNPGSVFPGVFGGICLLLALYALSVLPTNAAGVLLILLGLILFILEIKVTSFGMLAVGAIACIFIGSTMLFRFDFGYQGLPLTTVITTTATLSGFLGLVVLLVVKAQRNRPQVGFEDLIGRTAVVRKWDKGSGTVMVRGELWNAALDLREESTPLVFARGDEVRIVGNRGLVLLVRNLD